MKPTQKDLIDTDGENRAVRAFLLGREVGCKDYEQMRRHMTNSGFDNCWPSEFASLGGHMSKAAQQMWLRHLFALERFGAGGGEPPFLENPSDSEMEFECVALPPRTSLYLHPSPTDLRDAYLRGLEEGFKEGWIECSKWAQRDDLIADIGSPSYEACVSAVKALKGKQ